MLDPPRDDLQSNYIYWTDPENNKFGRANLDGTGVNPNFITGGSYPYEVAARGG